MAQKTTASKHERSSRPGKGHKPSLKANAGKKVPLHTLSEEFAFTDYDKLRELDDVTQAVAALAHRIEVGSVLERERRYHQIADASGIARVLERSPKLWKAFANEAIWGPPARGPDRSFDVLGTVMRRSVGDIKKASKYCIAIRPFHEQNMAVEETPLAISRGGGIQRLADKHAKPRERDDRETAPSLEELALPVSESEKPEKPASKNIEGEEPQEDEDGEGVPAPPQLKLSIASQFDASKFPNMCRLQCEALFRRRDGSVEITIERARRIKLKASKR